MIGRLFLQRLGAVILASSSLGTLLEDLLREILEDGDNRGTIDPNG